MSLRKAVREYVEWIRGGKHRRQARVPEWLEGAEASAWWGEQREILHEAVLKELERARIRVTNRWEATDIAEAIYDKTWQGKGLRAETMQVGQRVKFTRGMFRSQTGVVTEVRGPTSLVVKVDRDGRQVVVGKRTQRDITPIKRVKPSHPSDADWFRIDAVVNLGPAFAKPWVLTVEDRSIDGALQKLKRELRKFNWEIGKVYEIKLSMKDFKDQSGYPRIEKGPKGWTYRRIMTASKVPPKLRESSRDFARY